MPRASTSRRSGYVYRGGVMRRETEWFGGGFSVDTLLAASATAVLTASLNAAALALRPFTVVRTHAFLLVRSDQSAATESWIGNYGMCVVSDQAIAAGVGSVPTPATEQSSDLWFLHHTVIGRSDLIGTEWVADNRQVEIDSRAMRKVAEGSDIAIVLEAGIGGNGIRTSDTFRMLVKLH